MAKTAISISARDLPKLVDDAVVKLKAEEKLDSGVILDWGIMGRVLRQQDISFKEAQQLATDITGQLGAHAALARAGGQLEPAVVMSNGRIICGFFPLAGVELRF